MYRSGTGRARRATLVLVALVGVLALLASACGSDDDEPTSGSAEADPAGVLKLGLDFSVPGRDELDPVKLASPNLTGPMHENLYGTLLKIDSKGEVTPDLAESVKIVDPSNLVVTLKSGLVFSDGTPLDAEALKFSWERTLTQSSPGIIEAEFAMIETLTIASPLVLNVKLSSPVAGSFYRLLRLGESSPVSPTAVRAGVNFSTAPVGAGPFNFVSKTPGQSMKFVKSTTYWNAKNVKLGEIEYVNVTPQAVVTAVRSGTVDYSVMSATDADQAKGTSGFEITVEPTNGIMLQGLWCKNRPPFDDLKVRQAINYAIDRAAINTAVYDGRGEPSWGFNNAASPFYDATLKDFYKYDPDKAKQLLSEAGKANLTFESFFQPGSEGQPAAEVIQQQLAKVGVTITLKPLTNPGEFYPNATGAPINIFPLNRVGIQKVTRVLVPGTIGNICNWDDPELNDLTLQLQGVAESSPEGIALWKKISQNGMRKAVNLFGVFGVRGVAVNTTKLADVDLYEGRVGTPTIDVTKVYVKKS